MGRFEDFKMNVDLSRVAESDMRKWDEEEAHHHLSPSETRQLVKDHIAEFGVGYYPALMEMENWLREQHKK